MPAGQVSRHRPRPVGQPAGGVVQRGPAEGGGEAQFRRGGHRSCRSSAGTGACPRSRRPGPRRSSPSPTRGAPWPAALQGLTAGSFVPMSYASLSERVPERLPLALTTVNAAGGASAVVSQIVGQVLGSALGWRAVFLVSAPLLAVGGPGAPADPAARHGRHPRTRRRRRGRSAGPAFGASAAPARHRRTPARQSHRHLHGRTAVRARRPGRGSRRDARAAGQRPARHGARRPPRSAVSPRCGGPPPHSLGAQLPLMVGSVAGVALILAALLAACTGLLALAHRAAVRHGRTAPADASAPAASRSRRRIRKQRTPNERPYARIPPDMRARAGRLSLLTLTR
ncbi:MFS transporter [Streptomyces sp. NBC_01422]|uniref:MFS transporter n=1 Tax=Streptomyces sp. NBC_01422 TaxID=2903859 RepID=UPI003FCD4118